MRDQWLGKLKYVLLAAAVCLLLVGILNGDAAVVFRKAAAICLECIGIG